MSAVVSARVAELCSLHRLPAAAGESLLEILAVLRSDARAPTTVRAGLEAVDTHVADSLIALQLAEVQGAVRIVDIGTGAGFPGLPLAIALPQATVTLLDSVARKCAFVESMRVAAEASNARVVCDRAEMWTQGIGLHDLVTARALAPQATVLEYAAPLLSLGGSLVDWRGRLEGQAERAAGLAASKLGLQAIAVHRVKPFAAAREHRLYVYRKVEETPSSFPRRAGVARKRPLGG